jgi:hypothetical protein
VGNSFIGFPVPRAKIADMITGAAPPLIHHTDHETGGDDEVNCTGLAGAGGISLPLDDFYFHTFFENIDGYNQSNFGGGSVTLDVGYIIVACAGTINDRGQIYKRVLKDYVPLTWAKEREFRVQASFYAATNSTQKLEIGTGDFWDDEGFGFKIQDGLLKAYSKGDGGTYAETIEDLGPSGYSIDRNLRAKLTAGEKVEFWVNGVLVKTDSTCYPTGNSKADITFQATANNPSGGNVGQVYFSEFQVRQEA